MSRLGIAPGWRAGRAVQHRTKEYRVVIERAQAVEMAQEWLDAWNAHDPERVVAHFRDDVVVHSPLARRLRPGSNGVLQGKDAVLSYYRDGLVASPDLRFSLVEACGGVDDITIVSRH